jgi:hypothetical protein
MDPERRDKNLLILGGLGAAGGIGYGLGALHMQDSEDKPWINMWRRAERDKYGKYNPKDAEFKVKQDELEDIFKPSTKKSPWR